MAERSEKQVNIPTLDQVAQERQRLRHNSRFRRTLRSTVAVLTVVAAVAILISTLLLPVLQVYGSSMAPTLEDGDIVVLQKTADFETGDVLAFYYNNKILVKRVLGTPGDWINITAQGDVYVNDRLVEEPYVVDKALGECDIKLPIQVPDESLFVMGDHRSVSIDSRSSVIGCVHQDQIVGRVFLRVWPLSSITWNP